MRKPSWQKLHASEGVKTSRLSNSRRERIPWKPDHNVYFFPHQLLLFNLWLISFSIQMSKTIWFYKVKPYQTLTHNHNRRRGRNSKPSLFSVFSGRVRGNTSLCSGDFEHWRVQGSGSSSLGCGWKLTSSLPPPTLHTEHTPDLMKRHLGRLADLCPGCSSQTFS